MRDLPKWSENSLSLVGSKLRNVLNPCRDIYLIESFLFQKSLLCLPIIIKSSKPSAIAAHSGMVGTLAVCGLVPVLFGI